MTEHAPVFPVVRFEHLSGQRIPLFHRVRVKQPVLAPLADLETALDAALAAAPGLDRLAPDARVAVAVGSRGIAQLPKLVAGVVRRLKERGFRPFIVPSMGSHGGGTAEGQTAMLAKLGVDEASVGAPVHSSMETVNLGPVEPNVDCHLDRNASEADGIVIIARVKPHTSFDAPIESGLNKMVAVGLGKAQGARNVHVYGRRGLVEIMPRIAEVSLRQARHVLGVAVVENAEHELAVVEGVAPEKYAEADRRLLQTAAACMPRIPFEELDFMVIEELGKEISGSGIDTKVVGRKGFRSDPARPPFVHSTVALRVTPASRGNGIGVGNADIITRETANGLDLKAMYYNALTAACVTRACIPPVMETDLDAIRAGLATCWEPDVDRIRGCVIKSTAALEHMLVTKPLLDELIAMDACLEYADPAPLEFSSEGRFKSSL